MWIRICMVVLLVNASVGNAVEYETVDGAGIPVGPWAYDLFDCNIHFGSRSEDAVVAKIRNMLPPPDACTVEPTGEPWLSGPTTRVGVSCAGIVALPRYMGSNNPEEGWEQYNKRREWVSGTNGADCLQDFSTYRDFSRTRYGTCPPGSSRSGSYCNVHSKPLKELGCPVPSVGNPCNPATGNKYQVETDYTGPAGSALRFERYYNSFESAFTIADNTFDAWLNIGPHWTTNFSGRILRSLSTVYLYRPNGRLYYFSLAGDQPVNGDPDVPHRLEHSVGADGLTSGWRYFAEEGTIEDYDRLGRLLRITRPDGSYLSLVYGFKGVYERMVEAVDSRGLRVQFEYYESAQQGVAAPLLLKSVTLPDGGKIGFRYDSLDNLVAATYPDGTSRGYRYEDGRHPRALTGVVDHNGQLFASWSYDAEGRAISSEHAGGAERTDIVYNADGSTRVTAAGGVSRTYRFTRIQGVRRIGSVEQTACASCAVTRATYVYDRNGYVAARTDFNGNTTTYVHDSRGLETRRIEAFGTEVERRIDTRWHEVFDKPVRFEVYDGTGTRLKTTVLAYDAGGHLVSRTETDEKTGETRETRLSYHPHGQLASIDGPRRDIEDLTTFEYYEADDPAGAYRATDLWKVTNPLGQATLITHYHANGKPRRILDPNGMVTLLDYDARGRIRSRDAGGQITGYDYDANGNLTGMTLPSGERLSYTYDAARRLTAVIDGSGNEIHYVLDAAGNRIAEQTTDAEGRLTRLLGREFDELGRLLLAIGGEGQITRFAYDGNGNRVAATDPRETGFDLAAARALDPRLIDNSTLSVFDALDRLVRSTNIRVAENPEEPGQPLTGDDVVTTYAYDALDHPTRVTDPNGAVTFYRYNAFGDLLESTSPDSGTTTYTYDTAGNRLTQTDARGIVTAYAYDALNRLVTVSLPDPEQNVSFAYDGAPYGVGRLTEMSDSSGTTGFAYDLTGNLVSQTLAGDTVDTVIDYAYDGGGGLVTMTYPSGRQVDYRRDAGGRITSVTTTFGPDSAVLAGDISHLPFGPVSHFVFGNGIEAVRGLDRDYRVTELADGTLLARQMVRDAAGNITAVSDYLNPANDQMLYYDALNRLTEASGDFGNLAFEYDTNGNRTVLLRNGELTGYGYASYSNRLTEETGWTYERDETGNRTAKLDINGEGYVYAFSSANRLDSVASRSLVTTGKGKKKTVTPVDTVVAAYTVNGLGQRAAKNAGGLATHYLYGQRGELLAELDREGAVRVEYVYLEGRPLAVFEYRDGLVGGGAEVVADNDTAVASHTGEWSAATSPKSYGGDYRVSEGGNESTYRWSPPLAAGEYDVYAWWVANRKHATEAPYTVAHGSGSHVILTDQTGSGSRWVPLGTYGFTGAEGEYIELSNANGKVAADAVRFVSRSRPDTVADRYFVHTDHLGTPRRLSDDSGNLVWSWDSDPFGTSAPLEDPDGDGHPVSFNLRFPGQYFDAETGMHYNYFRDYEPQTGRFVQSDPIGLAGGFNAYVYVGANPFSSADRLGLAPDGAWIEQPRFNIEDYEIDDWEFAVPSISQWGYLKFIRVHGYVSGYINLDVKCMDGCREWEIHRQIPIDLRAAVDFGANLYSLAASYVAGPWVGASSNIAIIGAAALYAEHQYLQRANNLAGSIISTALATGPTLICLGDVR